MAARVRLPVTARRTSHRTSCPCGAVGKARLVLSQEIVGSSPTWDTQYGWRCCSEGRGRRVFTPDKRRGFESRQRYGDRGCWVVATSLMTRASGRFESCCPYWARDGLSSAGSSGVRAGDSYSSGRRFESFSAYVDRIPAGGSTPPGVRGLYQKYHGSKRRLGRLASKAKPRGFESLCSCHSPIAQLAERLPVEEMGAGSNPAGGAVDEAEVAEAPGRDPGGSGFESRRSPHAVQRLGLRVAVNHSSPGMPGSIPRRGTRYARCSLGEWQTRLALNQDAPGSSPG